MMFAADDGVHGVEIWKSDGTKQGTVLIKDIAPGPASSAADYLTVYNGKVYFSANDGVHGSELWSTDGTVAGTAMVKDINTALNYNNGSSPANLTVVNGVLVFTATDSDNVPTSAVFKTDGTAAGTLRLTELDYFGSGQFTVIKNNVFFTRDGNRALWKTDGTIAGTKAVAVDDYYTVDALRAVSDGLVFITNTSYRQNIRLYHLGADDDKAVLLHQFDAVTYGSTDIDNITAVNDGFFFSIRTVDANDVGVDYLWHSDGTAKGTTSIKSFDWKRYLSGAQMQNFVGYNNKLYFAATSNYALWSSDGTVGGTIKVSDAAVSVGVRPVISNNKLFYNSSANIWAVDASGTAKAQSATSTNPINFYDINNTLYFTAKATTGLGPTTLWNNTSGPVLTVSTSYYTITPGYKMSLSSKVDSAIVKTFTLKNDGNADLVLSEISVAGTSFYVNGKPSQVLKAGQQADFNLEYLPGKEKEEKGNLLIRSNDSFQGDINIDLYGSAIGKADIKNQLPGDGLLKSIDFTDQSALVNLTANVVDENNAKVVTVGSFSVKNNGSYTYQFVSGTGAADNNSFTINGDVLKTNQVFKYSDKNTYTIRVKATHDTINLEQNFTIIVKQGPAVPEPADCEATLQNMAYALFSADFAGKRIIAVGENGNILKSDNNGVDWSKANSGTEFTLNKVQFTDDKVGYASYVDNYQPVLIKTEDAGDNWFPVYVTDQAVKNTFFVSSNVGYAFTDQAVLKTSDGGKSWKKGNSFYIDFMKSVYFVDEQTGFICGTDRKLYRTKNGGDSWENINTVPLGDFSTLLKIFFTSSKIGYIISSLGEVVKTTDGGDTWIKVGGVNNYILDFYFSDDKTGYIIGGYSGSIMYKTVDGGVTWTTEVQPPNLMTFIGLKFNKSKTMGVAVGSGNWLGTSGGQGRSIWIKQGNDSWQESSRLPGGEEYYSVNFTDSQNGYVFGKYKTAKTTDGGVTWKEMPLAGTYGLRKSAFIKETGYAADLVDLYKTTDAGKNWTKILTNDSPDQIRSLYFLNADIGFYSTYTGSGLIGKTIDGGKHWTKTKIPNYGFVLDIAFFNADIGFGVGGSGTIVKTTDGGTTWKRLIADQSYWFSSVHIFDADNILVGGLNGLLLRSKDGGASWEVVRSAVRGDINTIKFVDNNHGYIFTGSYSLTFNTIYETLDGGLNWHYFTSVGNDGAGVDINGGIIYMAGNQGTVNKIATPVPTSQPGYINGEVTVPEKIKNRYTVAVAQGTNVVWSATGDAKLSSSGNTAIIQWNAPGKYQVQVNTNGNCGSGGTRSLNVTVDSALKSTITGPDTVLAHAVNVPYTATLHSNSVYNWVVRGDSTFAANTNKATINWAKAGAGKIEVIETQASTGAKTSAVLNVTIKNPPFSLPQTNFRIKAIAESCKESNNGQIKMYADRKLNYTAVVQIGNTSRTVTFTDSASVNNLVAGTYHVCISVATQANYQQCYDVVVSEPKDLSVYAAVNQADRTIALALDGGLNYNVNLNGTVYTTTANQITLELAGGDNNVTVTTDKECQGIFKQLFTLPQDVIAYPNPFVDKISLQLNTRNAKKAVVEIRDVNGKVLYTATPVIQDNKIGLTLGALGSGIYILKLTLDEKQSVIKIWKK